MIEGASHTWPCPACGRRVPLRAAACHCGTTRAQAEDMAAGPALPARPIVPRRAEGAGMRAEIVRAMGRDVKLLVGIGAFVLVAGVGWLVFGPSRQPAIQPVLGWVDQGPPPVQKKAPPRRPPFKLPWWK